MTIAETTHHTNFSFSKWFDRLRVFNKTAKLRQQIRAERKELLQLDAHQLADIGITHDDAVREARRPNNDVSANRLNGAGKRI